MKTILILSIIMIFISCEQQVENQTDPTDPNPEVEVEDISYEPLNTGSVTVTAENYNCPSSDPRKCYDLSISCEGVLNDISLTLYVDEPMGEYKGTITFHSGSGGKGFWAPESKPHAQQVLADVKAAGYRSVEVKWGNDGWLQGSADLNEGVTKLACRPATALKWIHDNLYSAPNLTEAFCATGNSGGSVQISTAILNYGLDKQLDLIVPTAGPGLGRIDLGCMESEGHPLFFAGQTTIFDQSYGLMPPGPCTNKEESFYDRFVNDSQAIGSRDFYYPQTMVWNLVGAQDVGTVTNAQSLEVYNQWSSHNMPYLHREVLETAGHGVQESEEGAGRISEILTTRCKQYVPYFESGVSTFPATDLKTGCTEPYYYLNGKNKHNKLVNVIFEGKQNVRGEVTTLEGEVIFAVDDYGNSCVNLNDHLPIGNYYLKFYHMDDGGKPIAAEDRNAILPIL